MEETAGSRVDLCQLKARLAKLGVHIDDTQISPEQSLDTPWESRVGGNNKAVAQLLDRCNRVQQVLNRSEEAIAESSSAHTQPEAAPVAGSKASGGGGPARKASAAQAGAGRLGSSKPSARCHKTTNEAAGSTAADAVAAADSRLLVRAAQRLLEDAQADAQQVGLDAVAAAASRGAAGRAAGGSGSNNSRKAAAAAATVASIDDLRNSPLGTVLAQYKEAQVAWAQEKAKLRREAVSARKAASQAQLELTKASRAAEHRAMEASALKAALKGRDVLLEELQHRVTQLEEELARCQEVAAERVVALSRERDDLQALLLATLERLEGVEAVVAAADATSAAMEEKVRVVEAERLAALQAAAAARQEVAQLQEARRRLQWQSQLLDKMSEVQLRHNKRKTSAIKELLASAEAATVAADSAACAAAGSSANSSRQEGCSRASAALQGLLDELLTGSNVAEEADD